MPVLKHEVMGVEIWEASDDEIRKLWNKTPPEDRHRFWSHEEFTAHILDTPEQVVDCLARKLAKPGRI